MFWRRFSQFQRRVQFSFVTRETLKTQFGSKKSSIERKQRRKKVTHSKSKKKDFVSLFTYFQLQSLKALLAKTLILLKLKTFFEISKPCQYDQFHEREKQKTDRTESHTSSRTYGQHFDIPLPARRCNVLRPTFEGWLQNTRLRKRDRDSSSGFSSSFGQPIN